MLLEKFQGRLNKISVKKIKDIYHAQTVKYESYIRDHRIKKLLPQLESGIVFLGPWLGEVGPEIQYWIPYLLRLKSEGYFKTHRLIALSRGGVQDWYKNLTNEYIEIFDYITTNDLNKIQNEEKGEKQIRWKKSEHLLVAEIAKMKGITEYSVIHPSDMWFDVLQWIGEKISLERIISFLKFEKFSSSNLYQLDVDRLNLPSRFIVMKFYHNVMFPLTDENQRLVNEVINILAKNHQIVLLGNPFQMGDHGAFSPILDSSVMVISEQLELQSNLGVQSEILRRSDGFIGTYGGLSVLPAFLGKPAISFYSTKLNRKYARTHFQHETITVRLYHEISEGSYTLLHIDGWNNLKGLLHLEE